MDILVLDKEFNSIFVIDTIESLIWTDRYNSYGDFEIYTPVTDDLQKYLQQDHYLWKADSEHMMIIDEKVITSDVEKGEQLTIRGRSLEFLLDRRIVWEHTVLEGNLQDGINRLLTDNIIAPSIAGRKIPDFIFRQTDDPAVTALSMSAQYMGDNLYEVIKGLCESNQIGFKITLNLDNQFVFQLYAGKDRSHSQESDPYVVFSPGFDNIFNSNYLETTRMLKNVALVAGEGEGNARKTATVGSIEGLARKEIYVDARDMSSETEDGTLTSEQYYLQLRNKGNKTLAENTMIQTFEGDVDASHMFVYGKDFFIGDIVQIMNEYGDESDARVTEIVFSANSSGNNIVPTFIVIPEKGEE